MIQVLLGTPVSTPRPAAQSPAWNPHPRAQPPFGVQHIALAADRQWRCLCWDRGPGTVVGRLELSGVVTGYDVELDAAAGRPQRVLPPHLRPMLSLVRGVA